MVGPEWRDTNWGSATVRSKRIFGPDGLVEKIDKFALFAYGVCFY